jgi:competence protein ComEA
VGGDVRGLLTRDERAVIAFLAAATAVGAIVLGLRKVDPALVPDLVTTAGTVTATSGELLGGIGQAVQSGDVTGPIDVNEATVDELTALPGIGPAKAAAIVGYREQHGRFASLDALLDVRGIGPATLARLRPMATLGDTRAPTKDQSREER